MPTSNARKHVVPSSGDLTVNRATIFQTALESVRDVVPVANVTARAQLVTDLSAVGVGQAPSSTKPLVVYRHDAPGMRRLEYTIDGTVWVPVGGGLDFANKAAADSWGTANGGYLTVGDRCTAAGVTYRWSGSAWVGLSAMVKRSSAAVSITDSSWLNISTTANWDSDWLDLGIAAYSNGWVIPFAGEWEASWGMATGAAATVGLTVNKATVPGGVADFIGAASAPTIQSAALMQARRVKRFAAGDVLRLFAAAGSGSTAWSVTADLSWFGIRYVGP